MTVKPGLTIPAFYFFWLWSAAILVVSVIPGAGVGSAEIGEMTLRLDSPLHAVAYFLLPVSAWMAWGHKGPGNYRFNWTAGFKMALAVSIVLAAGTEFLQIFVPGRTYNIMDILSNLSGIVLGIAAARTISRRKSGR
jgi:VanZ family protein